MKDDVAAPNLGQANKEFDAQYFWTTYRTIEQWMQQTTSKGNVSVASLTADTLAVEDVAVSGDVTIGGDLTVDGTIEGVLTAIPDPLVVNALTVNNASALHNTTVTGTLGVTGVSTLASVSVTGNATVGGTLGVTGATTLAGLTAASASVTGNATVGGTFGVTGVTTLTNTTINGNLTPNATGTRDLGSASLRWGTIYTSDLSLKNEVGDWTIVEGEDDLFITNNRNGKRYKFVLTEVG